MADYDTTVSETTGTEAVLAFWFDELDEAGMCTHQQQIGRAHV